MAIPVRLGGYQEMYQDKQDRRCGVFKNLARDWGISEEEGVDQRGEDGVGGG